MATKKSTQEDTNNAPDNVENGINALSDAPGNEGVEAPQVPATPATKTPTDAAKSALTGFPNYQNLYVNSHGGVFVPGTPEAVMGTATLYSNPNYKN